MELTLNELSYATPAESRELARLHMSRFIQVVRALGTLGVSSTVRTLRDFLASEVGRDYKFVQWMNDVAVNSNERLLFKTIAAKSPYLDAILSTIASDRQTEYDFFYRGKRSIGLAVAHLLDSPSISLGIGNEFEKDPVQLEVCSMGNDCHLVEQIVTVCCLTTTLQVEARKAWVLERIEAERALAREVRNGAELWERREQRWPNLIFCEGIERQTATLTGSEPYFGQILRHLDAINGAVRAWKDGRFTLPGVCWSYESHGTMNVARLADMRRFVCPDGQTRLCEAHTKLIGANIRLHFLPEREINKAYIGYIGPHLPI